MLVYMDEPLHRRRNATLVMKGNKQKDLFVLSFAIREASWAYRILNNSKRLQGSNSINIYKTFAHFIRITYPDFQPFSISTVDNSHSFLNGEIFYIITFHLNN